MKAGNSVRIRLEKQRDRRICLILFQLDNPFVADGDTEDIGCEIFEHGFSISCPFTMDDPTFIPDLFGNGMKQLGIGLF